MNIYAKKKILIICRDAGGAELISSWLKFNKISFSGIISGPAKNIFKQNVLQELQKLVCYLGFLNFICKFDIIINEHNWVLLDIGIDPPSRMLKLYLDKNINFYNLYVKQFFGQKVYFPFTNKI